MVAGIGCIGLLSAFAEGVQDMIQPLSLQIEHEPARPLCPTSDIYRTAAK
jgi:hypothetical protein